MVVTAASAFPGCRQHNITGMPTSSYFFRPTCAYNLGKHLGESIFEVVVLIVVHSQLRGLYAPLTNSEVENAGLDVNTIHLW